MLSKCDEIFNNIETRKFTHKICLISQLHAYIIIIGAHKYNERK